MLANGSRFTLPKVKSVCPNSRTAGLDQVVSAKTFLRAMSFESGKYKVRGIAADKRFDDEIDDFDTLLKKADDHASQMRKFQVISDGFRHSNSRPLEARLAALSDELLDTFQLVINEGEIDAIVNASAASDAETYQDLIFLVQRGYVVPVE